LKKVRNLIGLSVAALAVTVVVVLFINWGKGGFHGTGIRIPKIKGDLKVGNLFLTEEKEGTVQWELEAKLAESFRKDNKTVLEDLQVTMYGQGGRVVTLRGDRARIDERTRNMEVEGDVVVTSSDGLRLRTDFLQYDHSRREITTESAVTINGKGVRISGKGLRMELANETISILREVETSIEGSPLESG